MMSIYSSSIKVKIESPVQKKLCETGRHNNVSIEGASELWHQTSSSALKYHSFHYQGNHFHFVSQSFTLTTSLADFVYQLSRGHSFSEEKRDIQQEIPWITHINSVIHFAATKEADCTKMSSMFKKFKNHLRKFKSRKTPSSPPPAYHEQSTLSTVNAQHRSPIPSPPPYQERPISPYTQSRPKHASLSTLVQSHQEKAEQPVDRLALSLQAVQEEDEF